jgi:hypothetical protein
LDDAAGVMRSSVSPIADAPRIPEGGTEPTTANRNDPVSDRREIRELLENWVVWRDSGQWDRFRSGWHDDGVMMATWFHGTVGEFIVVTREGWDKGVTIPHFLGGGSIDLEGERAVSQTKMAISQRGARAVGDGWIVAGMMQMQKALGGVVGSR